MLISAQLVSLLDMMVRQSCLFVCPGDMGGTDQAPEQTSSTSTATPVKHAFTRQVEEVKTPKR